MNILVTGGAGYIGSATAEALTRTGHAVTVYDSLVTGHQQAVPTDATFVQADLSDSHALVETLTREKFDAVMHFAAFIEAGESMNEPGRFFQNNFTNSLILMENVIRAGVKRFVFSSTAAVYQSSDEPLTEESPLGPTNVYGQTKLMVEQALVQIVDNAAKYSPPGSPITVAAKRNGQDVVLSVHDEGAGLTPEENAQWGQRFFRGARHAGSTSGSGLGIWIAKAFVGANSGKIEAVSAGMDRGTTVSIHLPFTGSSQPEVGPDD